MMVSSTCLFVYHVYIWYMWRSVEGVRFPGIGIMDGCEALYWYWELKPAIWKSNISS